MITHKDTAAHVIPATSTPAVNVTISQHASSIAQTLDQVRAVMPGGSAGAMQSGLPSTGIHPGSETVISHVGTPGNGGTDPSHGGGSSSSLDLHTLNSGIAALLGHDTMSDKDPSQRPDLMMGSSPSFAAELKGAAASAGLLIGTAPGSSSGGASGSGGSLNHPDGSAPSNNSNSAEETMVGADSVTAGTALARVTYDDEGVHATDGGKAAKDYGSGTLGKAATGVSAAAGPTHDQMQYALDQMKSDAHATPNDNPNGLQSNNNNTGTSTGSTKEKPVNGITTVDGSDGSKTVTDLNNHTVTTLYKDGSSDTWKCDDSGLKQGDPQHTDAPKIPDEDHQTVNIPFLNLMHDAKDSMHQPSHQNDNRNVVDNDATGTVSSGELKGGADLKGTLLTDHTNGVDGSAGGPASGGPGVTHNQATPDFGGPDDNTTTTSADGPTPRTQPAMKTSVPQSSQEQSGGDHGGSHDSASLKPISLDVEAAVQHAESLRDASSSHKTAQSEGVHTGSDIASVLGGNSGVAGTGHDFSGFADLIRLAQNPVHSGLAAPAAAPTHDAIASLQLAALGDASHLPVQHLDDLHAAASAVALHDDHAHLTVPVVDHVHAH